MYTYPNGVTQEMVVLSGTIPVKYRNNTYNIPVAFYLPVDFPVSGPICYVKPTSDMIVKESQHVDESGRVYLPYLSEWSKDRSDFLDLIQDIIVIFSESPPVYQRPKGPANSLPHSEQENKSSSSENNLQCKICMDNNLEVVFIPCGHFVCCSSCAQSLVECPCCRQVISSVMKTYL